MKIGTRSGFYISKDRGSCILSSSYFQDLGLNIAFVLFSLVAICLLLIKEPKGYMDRLEDKINVEI
jgi:hypothetical protein